MNRQFGWAYVALTSRRARRSTQAQTYGLPQSEYFSNMNDLISRRAALQLAALATTGAIARPSAWAEAAAPITQKMPKVIAHWHYFPLSFDNKPTGQDYYDLQLLTVGGEGGKHARYGGFLRDRPLPRAPIPNPDWELVDMVADVQMAIDAGIEAFQLNLYDLSDTSRAVRQCRLLLEAAKRSDGFTVFPCVDCSANPVPIELDKMVQWLAPLLTHERTARTSDGKPMLSCFLAEAWPIGYWRALLTSLKTSLGPVYFAPMFLNPATISGSYIGLSDAIGVWTGNHISSFDVLALVRDQCRTLGKQFMSTIWPQDYRPRDGWFAEAHNTTLFRTGWQFALDQNSDFVNILTWNDYSENSHVRPSVKASSGFSRLCRSYSDAYRNRGGPKYEYILLCYRVDNSQSLSSTGRADIRMRYGPGPFDQVEVASVLNDNASVRVSFGTDLQEHEMKPGVSSIFLPSHAGRIDLVVKRDKQDLFSRSLVLPIRDHHDVEDLLYRAIPIEVQEG